MRIAPFGPSGQCWEAIANLVQEHVSVDRIEGVFEINRNEDFVGAVSVAVKPLRSSLGADLSAQWGGNTDLERPEVSERAGLDSFAKALTNQTTESVADSDGADTTVLFLQGDESGARKAVCDGRRGFALGKEVDKGGKLLPDFIVVLDGEGVFEVLWTESGGACRSAFWERSDLFGDEVGVQVGDASAAGGADVREVRRRGGPWVFGFEGRRDFAGALQRRRAL